MLAAVLVPRHHTCLLETHFFRVKTISRMGSSGLWSQFVCGKFLLEVQKKAVSSPEGQIFMEPAGPLQQYRVTFSPKPELINQCFSIPKLRNRNCMFDDGMVCFSVQNQSQVSPPCSEGNLPTISGHLTLFLVFINSSMLFSPALPGVASSH